MGSSLDLGPPLLRRDTFASGGSEGIGMCFVTCEEWLRRPGTCGRPYPSTLKVHIWDEERDVEIKEPRKEGVVYFEGGGKFGAFSSAVPT